VDLDLHTRAGGVIDPANFERESLAAIGMPREVAPLLRLPHFSHLFGSDGYAAGYYSYLWAEMMGADAWLAFEESGDVFNPTLARALRRVLAGGNSRDPAAAYRQFRGRDPDPEALFQVRGFPTGKTK
jgi:peptidyl-dipeptidase Dcp